jgi:hypothetical protein
VLWFAAAANMVGFAGRASLAMLALGAAGACLVLAGGCVFLAHRRVARWSAFAVVVLAPVAVLVIFARHRLLWVAVAAVALVWLAIATPGWRWPRPPQYRGCPPATPPRPSVRS